MKCSGGLGCSVLVSRLRLLHIAAVGVCNGVHGKLLLLT